MLAIRKTPISKFNRSRPMLSLKTFFGYTPAFWSAFHSRSTKPGVVTLLVRLTHASPVSWQRPGGQQREHPLTEEAHKLLTMWPYDQLPIYQYTDRVTCGSAPAFPSCRISFIPPRFYIDVLGFASVLVKSKRATLWAPGRGPGPRLD